MMLSVRRRPTFAKVAWTTTSGGNWRIKCSEEDENAGLPFQPDRLQSHYVQPDDDNVVVNLGVHFAFDVPIIIRPRTTPF